MAALRRITRRRTIRVAIGGAASSILLAFLVLLGSGGPAARAGQAPLVGPLAVVGNTLVDQGQGNLPVTLRGVDVLAWTSGPYTNGFVDTDALDTLVAWGANFVRLAISADQYLHSCGNEAQDPNYDTELAQAVGALTSRGIYTVLDIHSSNPDCMWSASQSSVSVPLPGEDTAAALAALVGQFGSNRLVGYEPFNEPQGCAEADSGLGSSQFVPWTAEPGGWCPDQTEANLAWDNPGRVEASSINLLGRWIGVQSYQAPGMDSLYQTIMGSVPTGAPTPLVFLDANGWASSGSTFDSMGDPLAQASNLVQVFHPYDCQDTSGALSDGHQSAMCQDATPESCSTTSSWIRSYMADPATGGSWTRPVVFDEFSFPAQEDSYYAHSSTLGKVPILVYQHGYWVNNAIAAMQSQRVGGWAFYYLQNADVSDFQSPYSMLTSGITATTPAPWTPNANAAPAVSAMEGASLSCENPPLGFG